jgi:hypothetical protein
MGACGYVLSYFALNNIAIQGPRLSGHLLGTRKPPGVAIGAWAHVEEGYEDELDRADG